MGGRVGVFVGDDLRDFDVRFCRVMGESLEVWVREGNEWWWMRKLWIIRSDGML